MLSGKPIRRQGSFYLAATASVLFFVNTYQHSAHRLTGQRPNPSECARAGVEFVDNSF